LLDTVDLAASLHLDGNDLPVAVTAQQIDRPDRRRYSRRTSVNPSSMACGARPAAPADAPRRRPSADRVVAELGLGIRQHLVECDVNDSPFGLVTVQASSAVTKMLGAFIQFNGLYAPPSA
jgi:hypothetical protein